MLAELAEQLIRFHLEGSEETIGHIVTTLRLAEAGITAQLAAKVPVIDEQAERLNRKREYDREYHRRRRGGMVQETSLETIENDVVAESDETHDSYENRFVVPPKKGPPHPLEKLPLPEIKKIAAPLPLDWKPNAEHFRLAEELRLSAIGMAFEAARMADWAAKDGKCCVNWDAQFSSWLRVGKPKGFTPHGTPERAKTKVPSEVKQTYFVKVGTPQWDAWVAAGHKNSMRTYRNGDAGWFFLTEWPIDQRAAS